MTYYFDTEENRLSRETSHPNFVKSMVSDFYYNCTDEFSPFGNDDGADLLYNLEDWYRKKKLTRNITKWMFSQIDEMGFDYITKWMFSQIDEMGFDYKSKGCSKILDLKTINEIQEKDEYLILSMDNSIIATGFGQIKITGKIDNTLKALTLNAFERQLLINKDDEDSNEYVSRIEIMKSDLLNFI